MTSVPTATEIVQEAVAGLERILQVLALPIDGNGGVPPMAGEASSIAAVVEVERYSGMSHILACWTMMYWTPWGRIISGTV